MTVVTFVGSTLQGAIGFGMGLLAAPLLILLDPRLVPAPILVCTLVLTLLMSYRERRAMDVHGLRWAILGRIAGTVVAAGILAIAAADTLLLLFGVFILAAVAMSASGLRFEPTGRALVAAGVVSGVIGTVAAAGGPPLALLYQDAPGARIRSTISGFFVVGTIVSLAALWLVGRFGAGELRLALVMLPGMLAGLALSRSIAPLVDRGYNPAGRPDGRGADRRGDRRAPVGLRRREVMEWRGAREPVVNRDVLHRRPNPAGLRRALRRCGG